MRTLIVTSSLLACVFTLRAQVVATMNRLPDGSTELRIRNESTVSLSAFAISAKYSPETLADNPLTIYVDPAIDSIPPVNIFARRIASWPVPTSQEIDVVLNKWVAGRVRPVFEQPVVAGILTDGTTTGDPVLLHKLLLRRSSMLLAVETTIDALADAGRRNVPREVLVQQFRKMADNVDRAYLPEQQIGRGVFYSTIGKLKDLPEGQLGSPFPPDAFVAQEIAALRQHRAVLLESLAR